MVTNHQVLIVGAASSGRIAIAKHLWGLGVPPGFALDLTAADRERIAAHFKLPALKAQLAAGELSDDLSCGYGPVYHSDFLESVTAGQVGEGEAVPLRFPRPGGGWVTLSVVTDGDVTSAVQSQDQLPPLVLVLAAASHLADQSDGLDAYIAQLEAIVDAVVAAQGVGVAVVPVLTKVKLVDWSSRGQSAGAGCPGGVTGEAYRRFQQILQDKGVNRGECKVLLARPTISWEDVNEAACSNGKGLDQEGGDSDLSDPSSTSFASIPSSPREDPERVAGTPLDQLFGRAGSQADEASCALERPVLDPWVTCEICYCSASTGLTSWENGRWRPEDNCGHHACNSCMVQYVQHKVQDAQVMPDVLRCPASGCTNSLTEGDVLGLLVRQHPDTFVKFRRFKRDTEVGLDPSHRRFCPTNNCGKVVILEPGAWLPGGVKCGGCGVAVCNSCAQPHHPLRTCAMVQDQGFAAYVRTCQVEREGVKCCPQCGTYIEKDEGCRHMTCTRCHHQFCWWCGANWGRGCNPAVCSFMRVDQHRVWGRHRVQRAAAKVVLGPLAVGVGVAGAGVAVGALAVAGTLGVVIGGPIFLGKLIRESLKERRAQRAAPPRWDSCERRTAFRVQLVGYDPSLLEHYSQRVAGWWEHQGGSRNVWAYWADSRVGADYAQLYLELYPDPDHILPRGPGDEPFDVTFVSSEVPTSKLRHLDPSKRYVVIKTVDSRFRFDPPGEGALPEETKEEEAPSRAAPHNPSRRPDSPYPENLRRSFPEPAPLAESVSYSCRHPNSPLKSWVDPQADEPQTWDHAVRSGETQRMNEVWPMVEDLRGSGCGHGSDSVAVYRACGSSPLLSGAAPASQQPATGRPANELPPLNGAANQQSTLSKPATEQPPLPDSANGPSASTEPANELAAPAGPPKGGEEPSLDPTDARRAANLSAIQSAYSTGFLDPNTTLQRMYPTHHTKFFSLHCAHPRQWAFPQACSGNASAVSALVSLPLCTVEEMSWGDRGAAALLWLDGVMVLQAAWVMDL